MPSPAMKSRPTISENDGSGGEGHSGGENTDDVFVYYGMGIGDGLDDLDGTPKEAEGHRQRYQAQLRAFNAKRTNRQGSVVEIASGGVSDAPSGSGEGESSLRSSNGGGGSDSANNIVGSANESAPTSPSLKDGREGTGGVREGESAPSSPAPFYSRSASNGRERVAQSIHSGRDRRNLEWIEGLRVDYREDARGNESTRAASQARVSAGGDVRVQRERQAPSPGESEFGFCSPIGLHVDQSVYIPQNWAHIQKSEVNEEWLRPMRLELEGHNEIGTFSADVVPKRVNVIMAKLVFT